MLLVFVGGVLGTAARAAVGGWLPVRPGEWPTATLLVNLVGAAILGGLLERLTGPVESWHGQWRLLVGTGFCGAFTTYSALAVETAQLGRADQLGHAVAYALVSVLAGLAAAAAGALVAR